MVKLDEKDEKDESRQWAYYLPKVAEDWTNGMRKMQ